MSTIRGVQVVLHALLGGSAIAAGQAFVRDPSGAALGMSTEYLQGSAFPDYLVPGLFLAVVIGGANLISAVALRRESPRGPLLSLLTGVLLVSWVVIQTGIIGYRHPSQVIWWVTFTVVAVLGSILTLRTAPEPVHRRAGE